MTTPRSSDQREREISERLAKATPGPWFIASATLNYCDYQIGCYDGARTREGRVLLEFNYHFPYAADAKFIAHAPEDIAHLLVANADLRTALSAATARAERLETRVAELEGVVRIAADELHGLECECMESSPRVAGAYVTLALALDPTGNYEPVSPSSTTETRETESEARIHGVTWLLFTEDLISGETKVLLERCPKKARVLGVGEWFVPGGKIEGDETESAALMREIREEWPGVRVTNMWELPILEGSSVPPGPRGLFLMRPFVVEIDGDSPSESSEGIELRWFPVAEALRSPVPQVRMMVAAFLASGSERGDSTTAPTPASGYPLEGLEPMSDAEFEEHQTMRRVMEFASRVGWQEIDRRLDEYERHGSAAEPDDDEDSIRERAHHAHLRGQMWEAPNDPPQCEEHPCQDGGEREACSLYRGWWMRDHGNAWSVGDTDPAPTAETTGMSNG